MPEIDVFHFLSMFFKLYKIQDTSIPNKNQITKFKNYNDLLIIDEKILINSVASIIRGSISLSKSELL